MQDKPTCPNCGADIADDSAPALDIGRLPMVEERGVIIGPPVVEHQHRITWAGCSGWLVSTMWTYQ